MRRVFIPLAQMWAAAPLLLGEYRFPDLSQPAWRFGIEAIMLPSHMPWRPPKFETLTGRIYCISATMLQLMYVMPTNERTETYEAHRQYERVLQYDPTNVEALRAPAAGSVGPALLTIQ